MAKTHIARLFNLDRTVYYKARKLAKQLHISLSAVVNDALKKWVDGYKKGGKNGKK
jgi:hypothetical protein